MAEWSVEDKIDLVAEECNLPYYLTEDIMRLVISKRINRRAGESIDMGMETTSVESFVEMITPLADGINNLSK
jgi:hypothetical protein